MSDWKGTGKVHRQPNKYSYSNTAGWVTYEVYEGSEEEINALAQNLAANAYQTIDITSTNAIVYRLEASKNIAPGTSAEEPVDTWELVGSGIQEDLLNHPEARKISDTKLAIIEEYIQNPKKRQSGSPSFYSDPITNVNVIALYELLKNKQNTYQESYYILRKTTTAGNLTAITYSLENVQKIHPFSMLPHSDINKFPGIASAVAKLEQQGPWIEVPNLYTFGWLKQTPQITASWNGKISVTQEWWLYIWSNFIYESLE